MKKYKMIINGEKYEAKVLSYKGNEAKVNVNGIDYIIEIEPENIYLSQPVIKTSKSYLNPETISSSGVKAASGKLIAPIPGVVIDVHKKIGDVVEAGDPLITLEAMKMESELVSPGNGKITEINVAKGDTVQEGDLLVVIAAAELKEFPKQQPVIKPKNGVKSPVRTEPKRDGNIKAPIPGTVVEIKVREGDKVNSDDVVIILEAMKMESEITAGVSGTVSKIMVSKGASVNEGDILVKLGE